MTTLIPIVHPRIQPLPLAELASLLRIAASTTTQRARPRALFEPRASASAPDDNKLADSLVSLVRGAISSYQTLDRQARRTFGPKVSLLTVARALLAREQLPEMFRNAADVQALSDLASMVTRVSTLMSPVPDVDTVDLRARNTLGGVRLYRMPVPSEPPEPPESSVYDHDFGESLVEIEANSFDDQPDLHLHLEYRNAWLPSNPDVVIKVHCLGPDPGSVSSLPQGRWIASDMPSPRDGRKIGTTLTSPNLPPRNGYVKTTLQLGSLSYEIWLATAEQAVQTANMMEIKPPKKLKDPTSVPTVGIHDPIRVSASPGTRQLIQSFDDFLRDVTRKYQSSHVSTSATLHTNSVMIEVVKTKIFDQPVH